jgi:hypothetical protein
MKPQPKPFTRSSKSNCILSNWDDIISWKGKLIIMYLDETLAKIEEQYIPMKAKLESEKAKLESEKAKLESEKAKLESEKAKLESENLDLRNEVEQLRVTTHRIFESY